MGLRIKVFFISLAVIFLTIVKVHQSGGHYPDELPENFFFEFGVEDDYHFFYSSLTKTMVKEYSLGVYDSIFLDLSIDEYEIVWNGIKEIDFLSFEDKIKVENCDVKFPFGSSYYMEVKFHGIEKRINWDDITFCKLDEKHKILFSYFERIRLMLMNRKEYKALRKNELILE